MRFRPDPTILEGRDARAAALNPHRRTARGGHVLRRPVQQQPPPNQPDDHGCRAGRRKVVNYAEVQALSLNGEGLVNGVTVLDHESGSERRLRARVVMDAVRVRLRRPGAHGESVSQPDGRSKWRAPGLRSRLFLRSDSAIMVPHTSDGRVVSRFRGMATRWWAPPTCRSTMHQFEARHRRGNRSHSQHRQPVSRAAAGRQRRAQRLCRRPGRWSAPATRPIPAALSRDHTIHIDKSALVTIAGGKMDDVSEHGGRLRQSGGDAGRPRRT